MGSVVARSWLASSTVSFLPVSFLIVSMNLPTCRQNFLLLRSIGGSSTWSSSLAGAFRARRHSRRSHCAGAGEETPDGVSAALRSRHRPLAIEWSVPKWDRAPVIPVAARLVALISIVLWLRAILVSVEIPALTGLG